MHRKSGRYAYGREVVLRLAVTLGLVLVLAVAISRARSGAEQPVPELSQTSVPR